MNSDGSRFVSLSEGLGECVGGGGCTGGSKGVPRPIVETVSQFEDDFVTNVKMNVRFLSNVKFNKTYFDQII